MNNSFKIMIFTLGLLFVIAAFVLLIMCAYNIVSTYYLFGCVALLLSSIGLIKYGLSIKENIS